MNATGRRRVVEVTAALVCLCAGAGAHAAPSRPALALLPWPASVERGQGGFVLSSGAVIGIPRGDHDAEVAARILAGEAKTDRGLTLSVKEGAVKEGPVREGWGQIRFVRDPGISGDEAYRLAVTRRGVTLSASGAHGMLYGAMTLVQLMSPDARMGAPVKLPAVTIKDAPRFAWRGLMVDVARHFQPIDSLYRIVDRMAEVKLNTLHLHLSDDQGWRFEVKKYPRLTEVGGWRTPPSTGGKPGAKVGGFYTQDQLKALVAYAAARGVTIVPEIDLPGHAQALVAAYPELGVFGDKPPVSHDWGINPWLFNPGPRGVAFVEDVLDELMDVFPGTYIHLGGDEAVKDQWKRSPEVQAQMRQLGIKDENALQSWLVDKFGTYLEKHGRRLIGWDEILEGGLPASASVMSWRGEKGAVDAANMGHDVVLSPGGTLYLDNLQSGLADEPPGRLAIQTLQTVYAYDPMPKGISPQQAKHVLGAQANAWSEYLVTPWQISHAVFPRAAALAETTWSPESTHDYKGFVTRLVPQIRRWRDAGTEVADSAFAVAYTLQQSRSAALAAKRVSVALSRQAPVGTIRYTLDGSDPTPRSPVYSHALQVPQGKVIRAASFAADGERLSAPRAFDTSAQALRSVDNSALVACPNGALGLRVPLKADATSNGPAYNINLFDTCDADKAAPLGASDRITVQVVRLARNYGLAHEADKVAAPYPVTQFGELMLTADCFNGEDAKGDADAPKPTLLMTFPLPDPQTAPQRFTLTGEIPQLASLKGDHDVCFRFTAPREGLYYTVGKVFYGKSGS